MASACNDSQTLCLQYEASSVSDDDTTQTIGFPSHQSYLNEDGDVSCSTAATLPFTPRDIGWPTLSLSHGGHSTTNDNLAGNISGIEQGVTNASRMARISRWLNDEKEQTVILENSSTDSETEPLVMDEHSAADSDEQRWVSNNGTKEFFPSLQRHFAAYFPELGGHPTEKDIAANKDEVANWLFNYVTHRNVVRRTLFNKMW